MHEELIFGKISNKRIYLTLNENSITIKSGGLAIINSLNSTKIEEIMIKDITKIEIDTPIMHPTKWKLKITQSSGEILTIPIFNKKQKEQAENLKKILKQ